MLPIVLVLGGFLAGRFSATAGRAYAITTGLVVAGVSALIAFSAADGAVDKLLDAGWLALMAGVVLGTYALCWLGIWLRSRRLTS